MDLTKISKGSLTSILGDLEEFATTPKPAVAKESGTRRKEFRRIAEKAVRLGIATMEEIGLKDKQIKAVGKGKPASSTFEQRQTLAAIVAGAARRCHVKVPTAVEKHFNV
jgi:hypothetical protein